MWTLELFSHRKREKRGGGVGGHSIVWRWNRPFFAISQMTKAWRCLGGLWLQTRRGYYAEAIEHGPVLQVGLDKCGASVDWQIQFAGLCCRRVLFKVWSRWEVTRFGRAPQKWKLEERVWRQGHSHSCREKFLFFHPQLHVFFFFSFFSASGVSSRVLLPCCWHVAGYLAGSRMVKLLWYDQQCMFLCCCFWFKNLLNQYILHIYYILFNRRCSPHRRVLDICAVCAHSCTSST